MDKWAWIELCIDLLCQGAGVEGIDGHSIRIDHICMATYEDACQILIDQGLAKEAPRGCVIDFAHIRSLKESEAGHV